MKPKREGKMEREVVAIRERKGRVEHWGWGGHRHSGTSDKGHCIKDTTKNKITFSLLKDYSRNSEIKYPRCTDVQLISPLLFLSLLSHKPPPLSHFLSLTLLSSQFPLFYLFLHRVSFKEERFHCIHIILCLINNHRVGRLYK